MFFTLVYPVISFPALFPNPFIASVRQACLQESSLCWLLIK